MDKTSEQTPIIDGILKLLYKGEAKKCWNCNKVLENREDEFCSEECDDLYYDIHKS
jgi:Zn finger protein HypA/HybF involved in hydrogenase expression